MPRNSRPGTCFPSTTRHTVSGVAKTRPSGPQSQVQNATDASSATAETPAAPAYNTVSSTRFVNSSSTTNSPTTYSGPALRGRKADQDRRACTERRPDVWDESENRSQHRPDQWVRHVEDVESSAGRDAVEQIDEGLHQELPADPSPRLVKRLRRDGQLAMTQQSDHPVAQVASLEQHEDDHRQHESRGAQRTDDWTEPREARETRDLFRGDDDGPRDRASGHLRCSKVRLDVFDRVLQLLDGSPFARTTYVGDLHQ